MTTCLQINVSQMGCMGHWHFYETLKDVSEGEKTHSVVQEIMEHFSL